MSTTLPETRDGSPKAAPPIPARATDGRSAALPLVLLGLAVVALACASLFVGAGGTPPGRVLDYLLDRGGARDDSQVDIVVRTLRGPRTLAALLVGIALGAAGALLQAATRNPLADTGLLGVNSGASLGVVIGITYAGAGAGVGYLPWALFGALVASAIVLLLSGAGRGGASPLRLVLVGAALAATLNGIVGFILLGSGRSYDEYRTWVLGSLSGVSMKGITGVLPAVAVGLVLTVLVIRPLSALALGDDVARGLGHRPAATRIAVAVAVTLLTAGAIALAGPLSFLGLVAGYLARHIAGTRMAAQVLASALTGAGVLLAADIVVRVIIRPYESSVAVMLSVIGGTLLIVIVRSKRLMLLDAAGDAPPIGARSAAPARGNGKARLGPDDAFVLRRGNLSVVIPRRSGFATLALAAVTGAVVLLCVAFGTRSLGPWEALRALFGDGTRAAILMVQEFGMPRIVAGLLVGAALGIAGCLTQSMARNRLATPDFLGVADGATLGVLLSVSTGAAAIGAWWSGPLGAVLIAGVILLLAGGMGTRGYRMLVVGLALSAIARSLTELLLAKKDLDLATAVYEWSVGSLNGRGYEQITPLTIGLIVLVPLALIAGRLLSVMRFSDDVASGLGVHVGRIRLLVLGLAVALAGLGVGVGGPIAFVALGAPIIAGLVAGPARVPILGSALVGASLVAATDTLGRVVLETTQVPVGVVVSVLGGPFLLWLLMRETAGGR